MTTACRQGHSAAPATRPVPMIAGIILATACVSPTRANDWDNSSGDAQWSNAVNWSGNIEPNSGTSALFLAGFPAGDTIIRLSPGENAFLVGFGGNYTLANFQWVPPLDTATLTLASGVIHASAGVSASIQVRVIGSDGLTKIGAGAVSLFRTTTTQGAVAVDEGSLGIRGNLSCNSAVIADDAGTTAAATVDGASARWNISGSVFSGSLVLGDGTATLNIVNGGQVQSTSLVLLGTSASSVAAVNMSGAGSAWTVPFDLYMGGGGATSTLNLTGGTLTVVDDIEGGIGVSTITLDGATLDMTGGAIGSGWPITHLHLRSGTLRGVTEINGGSELTKTGSGVLVLEGANTYTGTTAINAGTLKLSGDGSFASSPIIALATGATLDVAEVVAGANFNGTHFALAAGQVLAGGGTVVGPVGVGPQSSITVGASQSLALTDDADIAAGMVSVEGGNFSAPNIIDNGTLRITSGAITTPGVLGAGNDGALGAGSGTGSILISGGSVSAGAVLLGSTVGGSGDLAVSGTGELTTNKLAANDVIVTGGTITVLDESGDPPDAILDGSMVGGYLREGAFQVSAGSVTTPHLKLGVTAGMTGAYEQSGGALTAGTISVGSAEGGIGAFRWSGGTLNAQSLAMAGTGTLGVTLAGDVLGSDYAQLQLAGSAALAGTLEIVLDAGFEPEVGDTFVILTFGARSGAFAQVEGLSAGPGKVIHVRYNPNDVTLVVEALQSGDCDSDGDVDLADHGALASCLGGPAVPLPPGCNCFDTEGDDDVDLADWARFQAHFSGP